MLRTAIVCLALLAATFASAAPAALAYDEATAGRLPEFVANSYSGWTYVATTAGSAPVWKWTPGGWQATGWPAGTPAWAQPFATGWHWAWSQGSWYAIQTSQLASWSCAAMPAGGTGGRAMDVNIPVFGLNTVRSKVLGYSRWAAGDRPLCENGFPEASIGHTTYVALPPCSPGITVPCAPIPTPFMLIRITVDPCATAIGRRTGCVDPLRQVTGYVRVFDIWQYL